MLWSTVRSTSNAPAARLRRAPFLVPDQPISATVFTSCPTNSLRSLRGTHSSSSTRTGTYQRLDALFQRSHRLLPGHRREVVEKVVQSMSALQVVQKRFHGHTSTNEDGRPPEYLRITVHNGTFLRHDISSNYSQRTYS